MESPSQNEITIMAERPDAQDSVTLLSALRGELAEKYPDELRGVSVNPNELMIAGAVLSWRGVTAGLLVAARFVRLKQESRK